MRCQEIIELEGILGSCLVQPLTPGQIPGIYLILVHVRLSHSDVNTVALPGSLCCCSVVPTVRNLLDLARVILSVILTHNFMSYQTQAQGRDYPLFAGNFYILEDYYWVSFQIYFLNSSSSFSLSLISGCVLWTFTHLCSPLNNTFLQCLTWIQDSCGSLLTDVKGKIHTSCKQWFFFIYSPVCCLLPSQ